MGSERALRIAPRLESAAMRVPKRIVTRALEPTGYRLARTSGRLATIHPDDRMIVSYPRSGNTWLGFMLTNLIHANNPTRFSNLEERRPNIHRHSDHDLLRVARPRLLKSHEVFDPRYQRVLYLVRDPQDVVVSYRLFLQKSGALSRSVPLESFVDSFLAGSGPVMFGTWGEHVGGWLGARGDDDSFLLVRYEDFREDPVGSLMGVAEFLRIPASASACEQAVSLSAAERMREIEREETAHVTMLRDTDQDIPLVGPAEVGRGRAELSDEDQRRILERWERLTTRLGYAARPTLST